MTAMDFTGLTERYKKHMAATGLAKLKALVADNAQTGPVHYFKKGETTIKLLLPPGVKDFADAFIPFKNRFVDEKKGKTSISIEYLVPGLVVKVTVQHDDSDEDGAEQYNVETDGEVVYFKVKTTVLNGLIEYIEKNWKLFSVKSRLITIKNLGVAPWYTVMGLQAELNTADLDLNWPEVDIWQAAKAEQEKSYDDDKPKSDRARTFVRSVAQSIDDEEDIPF